MMACVSLFLTGCLHYHVAVKEGTDPLKPTFELKEGILFKKTAPLHAIEFYRINSEREPVWGIIAQKEYTAILGEITYGIVPPGFIENFKAKALEIGQDYEITIYYGDYGGGPSFKIIEKDGKPEIQMINK